MVLQQRSALGFRRSACGVERQARVLRTEFLRAPPLCLTARTSRLPRRHQMLFAGADEIGAPHPT